jgi:hypothetical protein
MSSVQWKDNKQSQELSNTEKRIFTFALCMLLHLLYSKPTHALLLNTLSHRHFKTLKLLQNIL